MNAFKILSILDFTLSKFQFFNSGERFVLNLKAFLCDSQFEGVKVFSSDQGIYLISVVSISHKVYPNSSMMMRVAKAMAQSQASTFLNGSNITMDMVMSTSETETTEGVKSSIVTMMESIKQSASGFVKALELLSNFEIDNGDRMLFIYMKKMD